MTRRKQKRKGLDLRLPNPTEMPDTVRLFTDGTRVTWDDEDAETSENKTYTGAVRGATFYSGVWVYMVETAKDTFQIVLEEELALVHDD